MLHPMYYALLNTYCICLIYKKIFIKQWGRKFFNKGQVQRHPCTTNEAEKGSDLGLLTFLLLFYVYLSFCRLLLESISSPPPPS